MNPNETFPTGSIAQGVHSLTPAALQLQQSLQTPDPTTRHKDEPVHIPDTADHAYWAYEQLRNAVEYQEQHLLMRSSIARFLNRHFTDDSGSNLGFELITELTKTRYLANNSVGESVLRRVSARIGAYQLLYKSVARQHRKQRSQLLAFIIGIASSDIQHLLLPNRTQDAMLTFTYHSFYAHLDLNAPMSEEMATSLYASVHKSLLKSDEATIHHALFTNRFVGWDTSVEAIDAAALQLPAFRASARAALRGRFAYRFNRLTRNTIAPYIILLKALGSSDHPEQLLATPQKLISKAGDAAEEEYAKARRRLRASVLRAVVFLLITKTLLGLALEIPFDIYVHGHINPLPLIINLLFPPFYMAVLGFTIKTPGPANTDKILRDAKDALYTGGRLRYSLARARAGKTLTASFNTIYAICSLLVLGGASYVLYLLQFNIVSGIIFFVFLSTVSFFGYRISQSVRELLVVTKRTVLDNVAAVVFTPFIMLGQWLSSRYAKINIFIIILDFIIEAPFKTLLKLYEQWLAFLREKQDDVL